MIIGTVRPEEARIFDSHEGYHQFHFDLIEEGCGQTYGSFEVFFQVKRETVNSESWWPVEDHVDREFAQFDFIPGWYWRSGFPGCLPDGDPVGPFATSRQAHEDADEWSPEYDEDDFDDDGMKVQLDGLTLDKDAVVALMDDELREDIHSDWEGGSEQEFLDSYVVRHLAKFGEDFTVN